MAVVVGSTGAQSDMSIELMMMRQPKKGSAARGSKVVTNGSSERVILQMRDGKKVACSRQGRS